MRSESGGKGTAGTEGGREEKSPISLHESNGKLTAGSESWAEATARTRSKRKACIHDEALVSNFENTFGEYFAIFRHILSTLRSQRVEITGNKSFIQLIN